MVPLLGKTLLCMRNLVRLLPTGVVLLTSSNNLLLLKVLLNCLHALLLTLQCLKTVLLLLLLKLIAKNPMTPLYKELLLWLLLAMTIRIVALLATKPSPLPWATISSRLGVQFLRPTRRATLLSNTLRPVKAFLTSPLTMTFFTIEDPPPESTAKHPNSNYKRQFTPLLHQIPSGIVD